MGRVRDNREEIARRALAQEGTDPESPTPNLPSDRYQWFERTRDKSSPGLGPRRVAMSAMSPAAGVLEGADRLASLATGKDTVIPWDKTSEERRTGERPQVTDRVRLPANLNLPQDTSFEEALEIEKEINDIAREIKARNVRQRVESKFGKRIADVVASPYNPFNAARAASYALDPDGGRNLMDLMSGRRWQELQEEAAEEWLRRREQVAAETADTPADS